MNSRSARRLCHTTLLRFVRRRTFLAFSHATLAAIFITGCLHCPRTPGLIGQSPPSPEILQAGDLIWPRPPNVVVPYRMARNEGSTGDPKQWEEEKTRYLASLTARSNLTS